MIIEKLESEKKDKIYDAIKNYISAWLKIPSDIDVNNLNIERIRFVKEWGPKDNKEFAYIIEFHTKTDFHRELLSESELDLTVDEHKKNIKIQNENFMLFAKDVLVHDMWYEYPVVFGELDTDFDDTEHYDVGGKYFNDNYRDFKMRYED